MLCKTLSASVYGIDAYLVEVEVDVGSARMTDFNVVGLQKYVSKISGPLLDRIDVHIEVPAVKYKEL